MKIERFDKNSFAKIKSYAADDLRKINQKEMTQIKQIKSNKTKVRVVWQAM